MKNGRQDEYTVKLAMKKCGCMRGLSAFSCFLCRPCALAINKMFIIFIYKITLYRYRYGTEYLCLKVLSFCLPVSVQAHAAGADTGIVIHCS
jgi:hypothetical protein